MTIDPPTRVRRLEHLDLAASAQVLAAAPESVPPHGCTAFPDRIHVAARRPAQASRYRHALDLAASPGECDRALAAAPEKAQAFLDRTLTHVLPLELRERIFTAAWKRRRAPYLADAGSANLRTYAARLSRIDVTRVESITEASNSEKSALSKAAVDRALLVHREMSKLEARICTLRPGRSYIVPMRDTYEGIERADDIAAGEIEHSAIVTSVAHNRKIPCLGITVPHGATHTHAQAFVANLLDRIRRGHGGVHENVYYLGEITHDPHDRGSTIERDPDSDTALMHEYIDLDGTYRMFPPVSIRNSDLANGDEPIHVRAFQNDVQRVITVMRTYSE